MRSDEGWCAASGSMMASRWWRRENELACRIGELHAVAADRFGVANDEVLERVEAGDFVGAIAALTAWCAASVSGCDSLTQLGWRRPMTCPEDASEQVIRALLHALDDLGEQVAGDLAETYARRLVEVDASLRRMSLAATSAQLVDEACEYLARQCGFGRAVLSRVESNAWYPWVGAFGTDDGADEWFGQWIDEPIPLDDSPVEADAMSDRRPLLVTDTGRADVYRPIIVDAGRSTSYAVAPVITSGHTVGFFHVDHDQRRRSGMVDRDVVWTFAQGFALAYEKLQLTEQLCLERERFEAVVGGTCELLRLPPSAIELFRVDDNGVDEAAGLGGTGLDPSAVSPSTAVAVTDVGSQGVGSLGGGAQDLTPRERDVIELLAVGATNADVARRLAVSESTVKSHVRQILRKLGATNRAQAVAVFLGNS